MRMTVGEIRRRLHEAGSFNFDMCDELFAELEGTLKLDLGEENVKAIKTSKSKAMLGKSVRYFGRFYVTRNIDHGGNKTYETISDTVKSVLTMLDGKKPEFDDSGDDHSYVSSFATIDIERVYGTVAHSPDPFDGYTIYVIQHLDKNVESLVREAVYPVDPRLADSSNVSEFDEICWEMRDAFESEGAKHVRVVDFITGREMGVQFKRPFPINWQETIKSIVWMVTGEKPTEWDRPFTLETRRFRIENTSVEGGSWGCITVLFDGSHKNEQRLHEVTTVPGYQSLLDQAMNDMLSVNKTLEKAHELAPSGAPKAIIMGLHSDVFNTVATFREYIGRLKGLKG